MVKPNYRKKSTISLKQFIAEFGESFSEHMKERLMDLESRGFLTRKEIDNRFDLKHVEHLQFECPCDSGKTTDIELKEYSYAQFEVNDGILYFSENCLENSGVKQSPKVSEIYNSLGSEGATFTNGRNLKKIDDANVDYVVDSILTSCPEVSQRYLDIVQGMTERSNNK